MIRQSFSVNLHILELIGFCPPHKVNIFLYKLSACMWYCIFLIPIAVGGILAFSLKGSRIEDYNNFIVVGLAVYMPKFLPFITNGRGIKKCIYYVDSSSFRYHQEITGKCIYVCRRNSTICCLAFSLGWIGWAMTAILWGKTGELPINMWLPFEITYNSLLFKCVYVTTVLGVGYACIICGAIDPLMWGLFFHATCQLKILKQDLQHLGQIDEATRRINQELLLYHKICACIDHYQAISEFVHEFEQCFSQVIFSQLAGSIFLIGLCGLQISKITQFSFNAFMMVGYLFCVLFQIYCTCFYAATLYEENNTLCNAVYMGHWYEYERRSQKALLILMERSKRPMMLTVGKILYVSLETFTLLIKRSYGLLAVLQNFT